MQSRLVSSRLLRTAMTRFLVTMETPATALSSLVALGQANFAEPPCKFAIASYRNDMVFFGNHGNPNQTGYQRFTRFPIINQPTLLHNTRNTCNMSIHTVTAVTFHHKFVGIYGNVIKLRDFARKVAETQSFLTLFFAPYAALREI
jgi:hypothetical protein